jgi:glycosyltransferase involved in cell wall biosynthesis
MESLNIAFFCWESIYAERVGGLASAATNLAETLSKHHTVHYFTRGALPDRTLKGVSYHYCQPHGNNTVQYCDDMSRNMVEQFHAADRMEKFDILHFHDWHPIQALHHLQDRDTILTFHSTEFGRNGNRFGDWWEYREISGKEWYGGLVAKRVTAVSSVLKNEVMQLYNIPEWKCDVVPNGIVPRQYRAAVDPGEVKKAYGIHPYAPLILFIGRLVYQKGPDLLIEAIRKLCRERWDARVIVAGDGGMRQYLQERSRDLPINYLGYIPDSEYVRLLNACDLVVIPSRNEPFGLVLLEAWSAEKPVVASDVGGLSENIDPFVNGIKTWQDPDSLAWGIGSLINDPKNAEVLGRRGCAKVDRMFQWGPVADRMLASYARGGA